MSARFEKAFAFIARAEGGYASDPADAGGETFRGISRRAHPGWTGWTDVDAAKKSGPRFRRILAADPDLELEVKDFYDRTYWRPLGLEGYPVRIGLALLDTFVQHGKAAALIQETLNACASGEPLPVDNVFGAATRKRLAESVSPGIVAEAAFVEALLTRRMAYYNALAARPGQSRFLAGWLRRLDSLRACIACLDDPGPNCPKGPKGPKGPAGAAKSPDVPTMQGRAA